MLKEMLEPGQRKLVMTLVAVVGAVLLEKFGGGLSPDLKQFILSALGIYAGTNVLSKGIHAIEAVKTQRQEDTSAAIPDYGAQINKIVDHVNKLDVAVAEKFKEVEAKIVEQEVPTTDTTRLDSIEERIGAQALSISKILGILKAMQEAGVNGSTQPHR